MISELPYVAFASGITSAWPPSACPDFGYRPLPPPRLASPTGLGRLIRFFSDKRKVVLFAWELGGGVGHIQRLLPIARELAARDCRVVFALRRLENTEAIRRELPGAKLRRAPFHSGAGLQPNKGIAYHYADVLHRCGYDSADSLGPLVGEWREILASLKPALVVCDHSPTVVLAAAGRVPVVHLGSGFATPPAGRPFLALHPPSSSGSSGREAQVLRAIQKIQSQFASPGVERVCDLLSLTENFACCLPELDPYKSARAEPAAGPVQKLPAPQPLNESAPVFGYLAGDEPRTARTIESLAKANVPCGLYIRQRPPEWARMVAGSAVTLYPGPQKMPDALAAASAIAHHGGLATAEMALALGRPQFLFPRNLEQLLTANAVEKLGCGVNLTGHGNPGDAIQRALARGTYRKEAAAVAARIAARGTVDVTTQIVTACVKHLTLVQP